MKNSTFFKTKSDVLRTYLSELRSVSYGCVLLRSNAVCSVIFLFRQCTYSRVSILDPKREMMATLQTSNGLVADLLHAVDRKICVRVCVCVCDPETSIAGASCTSASHHLILWRGSKLHMFYTAAK
jgi:hypothetical protein